MKHIIFSKSDNVFSTYLLLNFIIYCVQAIEPSKPNHNQAFIQTDKELKFIIDGVQVNFPPERFPDLRLDDGKVPASPVRFDPPYLDFKENPVGQPHLEQVTLINPDVGKTVHLLSISASTSHFHCSFFQKKMVPAGGNTTFDVVFLSREVGNVENTLFIHTSRGTYKYQVFGVGVPSPYRLQPFVGARIPVNTSFTPYIQLYNPHPFSLQITEMYTSGGDLHLELPTSVRFAPKKMWEVPPYETRTVMRVRMVGRRPANNSAFVKVKTNLTEPKFGFVVPIEVEVSNKPGLYSPTERLNFGILRTLDNPKSMKLVVINSSQKPIHITSIELDKPNDAVSIDFRPMKIQPGVMRHTTVAMVTFTAQKALRSSQWSGRVVVKSRSSEHELVVPYVADVLHGSLVYDANSTKFFAGTGRENISREIIISNTFNFTIVIYHASLDADANALFEIQNFTRPVMIAPQESKAPFRLRFKPGGRSVQFITRLGIFSNASLFVIPLFVYHGKLTVVPHRPELYQGHLEFGTLGVEESRSLTFTLRNENPVDVHISEMNANWDRASIKLKGIERGNGTTLTRSHNVSQYKMNPLILKPYHYAVFNVILTAPEQEGVFASDIKMVTQFETLSIPYYVRTAQGSLSVVPETVVIENSFPGRVSSHPLVVQSTFAHLMELKSVRFQPDDARFQYRPLQPLPLAMKPLVSSSVGTILFDPMRGCRTDARHEGDAEGGGGGGGGGESSPGAENSCYIGFNIHSQMGHQWLLSLSLDKAVVDVDQYTYTRLLHQWDALRRVDGHVVNVTLLLDASQVRGFLSKVQAHLVWPRLLGRQPQQLEFPLTQLGNSTYRDLVLDNPADVPILVQVLPLSAYPSPSTLLDLLGIVDNEVNVEDSSWTTSNSKESKGGSGSKSKSSNNSNNEAREVFRVGHPSLNRHIESVFGVEPHAQSVALILKPRTRHAVRVEFRPAEAGVVASYLLVRSNLTGLETVRVSGRGGQGRILFANSPPEEAQPLLFELTEKHLRNCDKSAHTKGSTPSFTVRRPFTLRNPGHLPVYIHGFTFGPYPGTWCHGYGFSVLDCSSFDLGVNQSRKVDLAFTPDFSLHRVQQSVRLHTSLGDVPFNLTVQATLPAHMLTRCSQALSRPEWEVLVWYFVVGVSSFVFVCILVTAYFDADRMFTHDVITRHYLMNHPMNQPNAGAVFDLKKLATAGPQAAELMAAAVGAPGGGGATGGGVGGAFAGAGSAVLGASAFAAACAGVGSSLAPASSVAAAAAAVASGAVHAEHWPDGLRHRGSAGGALDSVDSSHVFGSSGLEALRRAEPLLTPQGPACQQHQRKKKKKSWRSWLQWARTWFSSLQQRSALRPRLHDNVGPIAAAAAAAAVTTSSASGASSAASPSVSATTSGVTPSSSGARLRGLDEGGHTVSEESSADKAKTDDAYLSSQQQQQSQQQSQQQHNNNKSRRQRVGNKDNRAGQKDVGAGGRWRAGSGASGLAADPPVPVPDFAPIDIPVEERGGGRRGGGGSGQRGRDGASRRTKGAGGGAEEPPRGAQTAAAAAAGPGASNLSASSAAAPPASGSGSKATAEDSASSTTESSTDDKACRQSPEPAPDSSAACSGTRGGAVGANSGATRRSSGSGGASPTAAEEGRGSPEGASEAAGSGSASCLASAGATQPTSQHSHSTSRGGHKSRNDRRKPPRANVWEQQQQAQQQQQQAQQQAQQQQAQQQQQSGYPGSSPHSGHPLGAPMGISHVRDAHDLAAEIANRHLNANRQAAQASAAVPVAAQMLPMVAPAVVNLNSAFKTPLAMAAPSVKLTAPNGQKRPACGNTPKDMEQLSSQSEQFARDLKLSDAGQLGGGASGGPSFVGMPPFGPSAPPFADNAAAAANWYATGGPMRGPHVTQGSTVVHRMPMTTAMHMRPGMQPPHLAQLAQGVGADSMLSPPPRVGELQRMNREKRSAMLEYERSRQQQQQQLNQLIFPPRPVITAPSPVVTSGAMDDVPWLTGPTEAADTASGTAAAPWSAAGGAGGGAGGGGELDMQAMLDPALVGDPIVARSEWGQPSVTSPIWSDRTTRALWDLVDETEVPPGSQRDHLAAHLIPGDLLGSDTSSPGDDLRHSIWNPLSSNAGGPVQPATSSTPPGDFDALVNGANFGGTPPPNLSS